MMFSSGEGRVRGPAVHGRTVGDKTRCAHYNSELDIIAVKFKCCGLYYPCYECHREAAGHEAVRWPAADRGEKAVLCGACRNELTIEEYLSCGHVCPFCGARFNPGCSSHRHLYFDP